MTKRIISLLTTLVMAVSLAGVLPAMTVGATTSGDYEYTVLDDGTVAIIDYYGDASVLEIPSKINGKTVTSIGDSAFYCCYSLTSVTIGNSVTSIGDDAFLNCSNLTSITIPDSVTSIGSSVFSGCDSLTSITIPDSVTSIGDVAFASCDSLTSITIPDSVTSIGYLVFDACYSLTEINVDTNNKNYSSQDGVLFDYEKTELIQYPDGKTQTTYIIPNSVTSIGYSAFSACGLTSITIPNSVTSIGDDAFCYCKSLTSVIIPDSVTSIGDDAFCNCKSLTSVIIPDSVTSIGYGVFSDCDSLTSITIPDSVTSIGKNAFSNCKSLTSVIIPDSVTSIGQGAFWNCSNLTSITIPDSVTSIGASTFSNTPWLENKQKENPLVVVNGILIDGTTCSGDVTIPNSVTSIGYGVFSDCDSLTSITIPDSVKSIGDFAFDGCTSLTSITIPKSVISIGDNAFFLCDSSLTIKCYKDSYAEQYAIENYIKYEIIGKGSDNNIGGTATGITNDQGIKLDVNAEFDIPDNIPGIGSEEFKLDLETVGISYTRTGNTFKIGVGVKEDLLKKDAEFKTFKKLVESNKKKYRESMKAYMEASTMGKIVSIGEFKPEASVYGYLEGTIDENGARVGTGKIVAKFKAKYKKEWQTIVVNIPVVISASLEVSVEGTASINITNSKSLGIDSELKFVIPKITPSIGIGFVKIANVSVYGELANEINLTKNRITAGIDGEAGVSAKLFNLEYKHAIWKPKGDNIFTYYDSQKKSKSRSVSTINYENVLDADSYEIAERTRSTEIGKTAANNENIKTILSGCSNDTKPQVVTFSNNKALMVYTDDVPTRTTGNQSAVMYKTFDGTEWSDAKILSDDGTADFYPQAASDGETAYITWMNSSKNLTSDSELTDTTKACDISVIKFDSSNMSVSGSETKLTNDSELDMMPTIDVSSTPTIMWVKNSNSDILTQTGTNTIYYSTLSGTSWTSAKEYNSYTSKPIIDLSVGNINGEESIAYTLDEDNDLTTTDDVELYAGKISETPAKVTNNNSNEQSIKFTTISGQNALIWFNNETLEYTKDLSEVTTLNSTSSVSEDYDIININNKDVAIFSVSENNGANLYASEIEDGFVLKEPVKLTDLGGYSRNISAKALNDKYLFAFTRTDATIEEDDVEEKTDLCVYYSSAYHNLAVSELEYNDEDIIPGQKAKMTVTVTNNGLIDESDFAVTVKDPNGNATNITVNETLKPGESRNIEIDVTIPENISEQAEFSVEATPSTGSNLTNNIYTTNIGSTDLQLSSQTNENDAKITVENISGFGTNATLVLKSGNSNGDIIDQINLGSINAGESKTETILFNKYNDILKNNQTIYIEVEASSYEIYKSDNYALIYANNSDQPSSTDINPNNPTNSSQNPNNNPNQNINTFQTTKSPNTNIKLKSTLTTSTSPTTIKKAKVKNLKAKSKGKKITVSWKKIKIAKGYQVQVATNKKFKKKKIVFDKFTKKKKLIIKSSKIKRKKTYYVRVRAYAKCNGKKAYGKWSKKIRVKIK